MLFSDPESGRVIGATLMAVLAMLSLIVGTALGLFAKPSPKLNAAVMAFGTGALIQAVVLQLAFEAAERIMHEAHLDGITSWTWVAVGFIAGGVIYYIGNRLIEHKGGALRHRATTKLFLLERKREESAGILASLSRTELVRSLPPEEMEDVLRCVQPVKVSAGNVIFRRGEVGDALYSVVDGRVDIRSDEAASTLAQLGSGQSFGEMALLSGEPRSATAVAVGDVALLKISKEDFDELIQKSPTLRHAVEELNSQRLVQNVSTAASGIDAEHWQKVAVANIRRLSRAEEAELIKKHAQGGAPLAIFLGAMLDGIPESIVIGASFISLSAFEYTFLAAVFLSNLPEAMASASGMKEAGFSKTRIFSLWIGLVVVGAIAAALGNIFLSTAPPVMLTLVEAIAGGGILAMISSVMMPEAYENGGPSVGLSTIAGFLSAFLFTFL